MTASSAVVLGNLAYLIGAVVLAIIGGLIAWMRYRQPQSIDANVESFHRGLQALAPDPKRTGSLRGVPPRALGGLRIEPNGVSEPDDALPDDALPDDPMPDDPIPDDAATDLDNPALSEPGRSVEDGAVRSGRSGGTGRAGAETG